MISIAFSFSKLPVLPLKREAFLLNQMKYLTLLSVSVFLFVIGCNTNVQTTDNAHFPKSDSTQVVINSHKLLNASTLSIDKSLLKQYEVALEADTFRNEKPFIKALLSTIHKFEGRKLDTTIIRVGNIDGNGNPDTITSRVYLLSNTVFVDSWWIQNHDTLWKYQIKNPYVSFSYPNLFEFDTRSLWVTFSIGVLYGSPSFETIAEFEKGSGVPHNMIIEMGLSDLREKGIALSAKEYEKYINEFKGDLISYGDPEAREGLYIWYAPGRCFITYYHA